MRSVKMSTSAEDTRLNAIIQQARISTHPLVARGMTEEENLRANTSAELEALLAKTRAAIDLKKEEGSNADEVIQTLKKQTLAQVAEDSKCAYELNSILSGYKAIDCNPGPKQAIWPLKSNKLTYLLGPTKEMGLGVSGFLSENFERLFDEQQMPQGYQFKTTPREVTRLKPNPDKIYGDWKSTLLKTGLLETYFKTTGKSFNHLDFYSHKETKTDTWMESSTMVHIAPLPVDLTFSTLQASFEGFKNFTFRYGQGCLVYPHSGYAFGGDRANPIPSKVYPPEDCSSWLEKICSPSLQRFTFSTADQCYLYQQKAGLLVPKEWCDSTGVNMANTFEVVQNWGKDPQTFIQPGQVYAQRNFNLATDPEMTGLGAGGHTALVLGFISDSENSQIVTLGYGRGYPESTEEGFGVQTFPVFPKPEQTKHKKVMIFSVKGIEASQAAMAQQPPATALTHQEGRNSPKQ